MSNRNEQMGLAIVELVGDFEIATTGGDTDDTPSALARRVGYAHSANAYAAGASEPSMRVYHAAVRRDGGGAPVGPSPLATGARGLAYYNPQSGRWELAYADRCGGEPICITVVTGVTKVGANLIFTRKEVCLPPSASASDLIDLSIECCVEEGPGSGE